MKTRNQKTVAEIAARVDGALHGEGDTVIDGLADLGDAATGDIAFVEDKKLLNAIEQSSASCLLVPNGTAFTGRTFIEVSNPKLAFAQAAELLHPTIQREAGIHQTALVSGSASLGDGCYIGPRVSIGEQTIIGANTQVLDRVSIGDNVRIGSNCVIRPGVVVYDNVTIGDRVILHAGAVIGADGFGYVRGPEGYVKFPQIGTVVIEDDVEIGSLTCIDRAALGRTRIGKGTKIDNLVQIAHNVDIGARVVIAAQTGISGSTVIEDDAVIGGQVGMGDHARVQSGAVIGSQAGVLPGKIVRPGVYWGTPVQPLDEYKRLNAHVNRLPQLREEVKELKREVEEIRKVVSSQ
jgi:UDP-3-O-[3-hydroxymyristoyl] glucosamine N-acyltransferase